MEMIFCQSCGMPLSGEKDLGSNADGSLNQEYCGYCYANGNFTGDATMEEMIEICAQYADKWEPPVTREEAIANMKEFFPTLKRWKKD